ncbi:hypothetical protein FOPG_18261 [Fusarium oxysporum f. sp. conglutinans race 2 54008]|uniref:Uncharacterized protein n=1 Tax=Fusarium oxysporum f. sp. conglutinans race 2 54008 TaxID=1089457 RepID=X0H089_FUSOX|nr:hypothetical protein FOPG_18261 [Fusarium oxysporum f. sp. conglutinans race 2 54008]
MPQAYAIGAGTVHRFVGFHLPVQDRDLARRS